MIDIDDLYLVNYSHPNCIPLQNIMRLPKEEAFDLAYKMAASNTDTTAFYRFADFENYYPHRLKVDKMLHNAFVSLGGNPKTEHPLSFVLQGSEYLDKWFGEGTISKIQLINIPNEYVSFTYGDSSAALRKSDEITLITKDMLLDSIKRFEGTLDSFMKETEKKHHYIEAQLWNDDYAQVPNT